MPPRPAPHTRSPWSSPTSRTLPRWTGHGGPGSRRTSSTIEAGPVRIMRRISSRSFARPPGMYGLRVHEAVLAAGATQSGCTIHLVDERVDGGPIVAQATVSVLAGDTPATLAARVAQAENPLYPVVVRAIAEGRLLPGLRAAVLAGG